MWGRYCCLTSFLPIVDTCLTCEDIARQSCAMVPRCQIFGDFFGPAFPALKANSDAENLGKTQMGSTPPEAPIAGGVATNWRLFAKCCQLSCRKFICLQHSCHDAACCTGLSVTADPCIYSLQYSHLILPGNSFHSFPNPHFKGLKPLSVN